MKNIMLKFLGAGYQNMYQGNIEVYDMSNRFICSGTTYNGNLSFQGRENTFYKVIANFGGDVLQQVFYVNSNHIYCFTLKNIVLSNKNRTIIFLLTDENYANLPIENGEIILWQK